MTVRTTFYYPVIFTPDVEEGGFVITFPDIPEAITQAGSIEEGLTVAKDCLEEAIHGYLRLGESIPKPSFQEEAKHFVMITLIS